ncbi:MAG: guanylate kinase [Bdellovibrionales bacterium]|nr:guanylate kinase [Bdellovibrionales bacterium]
MAPQNGTKSKRVQPRLIVVSAPSGAGKTTLCKMLLQEYPSVTLSISATTRPKRPNEVDGRDYLFLSMEQFEHMREAGEFAEWAQVHKNLYGTPKKNIDNALSNGKHVLFDIDIQGAESLRKLYPDRVLLVFIHPPSMGELEKRLKDRSSDSSEAIETRLQNAYDELEWSRSFDYQIVNDDLDRAYQELKRIFLRECQ